MSFRLFEAFFFFFSPCLRLLRHRAEKADDSSIPPVKNSNHFILIDTATGNISHTNFFFLRYCLIVR